MWICEASLPWHVRTVALAHFFLPAELYFLKILVIWDSVRQAEVVPRRAAQRTAIRNERRNMVVVMGLDWGSNMER